MNGSDNNNVKLVRFLKIPWNFSSKLKMLPFIYELMPRNVALHDVEGAGLPESLTILKNPTEHYLTT